MGLGRRMSCLRFMSWLKGKLRFRKVGVPVVRLDCYGYSGADYLEWHGMDVDAMMKALHVLVKRGKAQVFGSEGQEGVKFF